MNYRQHLAIARKQTEGHRHSRNSNLVFTVFQRPGRTSQIREFITVYQNHAGVDTTSDVAFKHFDLKTLAARQSGGAATEKSHLCPKQLQPPQTCKILAFYFRQGSSLRSERYRAKSLTEFKTLHRPNRVYKHPGRVTRVLPTRGFAIAFQQCDRFSDTLFDFAACISFQV